MGANSYGQKRSTSSSLIGHRGNATCLRRRSQRPADVGSLRSDQWRDREGARSAPQRREPPCPRLPLKALNLAIARDTLMALFRATDEPTKDRLTLCRIAVALENDAVREDRKAAARNWISSSYSELREIDAATCEVSVQAVRSAVPTTWACTASLADRRLAAIRKRLWRLRNNSLAHAIKCDGNNNDIVIDEIRSFLNVASELAAHAELIFLGMASNWKTERRRRMKEANAFWDRCQRGF
jgi:hypothetical protein